MGRLKPRACAAAVLRPTSMEDTNVPFDDIFPIGNCRLEIKQVKQIHPLDISLLAHNCQLHHSSHFCAIPIFLRFNQATSLQVIVLHRHGDRTPLINAVGAYQEPIHHRAFWESRLPSAARVDRCSSHPRQNVFVIRKYPLFSTSPLSFRLCAC